MKRRLFDGYSFFTHATASHPIPTHPPFPPKRTLDEHVRGRLPESQVLAAQKLQHVAQLHPVVLGHERLPWQPNVNACVQTWG